MKLIGIDGDPVAEGLPVDTPQFPLLVCGREALEVFTRRRHRLLLLVITANPDASALERAEREDPSYSCIVGVGVQSGKEILSDVHGGGRASCGPQLLLYELEHHLGSKGESS